MSIERINSRWAQSFGDDRMHYRARYIPINQPRRSPWHWLKGCSGLIESDEHGLWFQCSTCDRVHGFIPRDAPLDRNKYRQPHPHEANWRNHVNTYNVGPLTMRYVFENAGLTNVSDWQVVMDAVETALEPYRVVRDFIDKHHVSCAEATVNDGVYEEAPLLIEALADSIGYYQYPDEATP